MRQRQRISFMVEQDVYDRLKKCATDLNKPLSDVIEIAVKAAISEMTSEQLQGVSDGASRDRPDRMHWGR